MSTPLERGAIPAQNCCIICRVIDEYVTRWRADADGLLFRDLPDPYGNLVDPRAFLMDENNWVPSEVVVRLFENAKVLLDDPDAPFKIGFESTTERKLGYIQRFFIATFLSVAGVVRRMEQINAKFNTTKTMRVVRSRPGYAVTELRWNPNGLLSRDICRFNQGVISAIPTLWGHKAAEVKEISCHFQGAETCRFDVRWEIRSGLLRGIAEFFGTRSGHLLAALGEIERDKELLRTKYEEVNRLNLELEDKVVKLQAINEASRILVAHKEIDNFLDLTMKILVRILHFDRAIIMMLDGERKHLIFLHATGDDPVNMAALSTYRVPMTRRHNLMVQVVLSGESILVDDVEKQGLNPDNLILSRFEPHSFCVSPLTTVDREVIGILGADRRTYAQRITQTDLDYLTIFANSIAVSLQRAKLDDDLRLSYLSSVRSLVHALEEKDAYTKGHSERVAALAALIGQEMGLSEGDVEYLRIGGYVHDIGKIGVPESIIKSPKRLTPGELRLIQLHAVKGVEILEPIAFLKGHLHLVRHHHEHWDGSGYPDGLKGEEIPVGAQIMAVADAFDAMTSSRPYRRGWTPKKAFETIVAESGAHFSPRVVEVFEKVYDRHMRSH